MRVNKKIDLDLLQKELRDAGVPFRVLAMVPTGIDGEWDIHDQNILDGSPLELSELGQQIIRDHVAPEYPDPDFGEDEPPENFREQAAQVVQQFRAYLGLAAPTNAQSIAAIKLLIRVQLFIIRHLIVARIPQAPPDNGADFGQLMSLMSEPNPPREEGAP